MASQRTFRLDDDLDAKLVELAKADGRSISNLIVRVLEGYAAGMMNPRWVTASEARTVLEEGIGTLPKPKQREPQWESPAVSAKRLADLAVGTPLPKIAPRRKAK